MATTDDISSHSMKRAQSAGWISHIVASTLILWISVDEAVAQQSEKIAVSADIYFPARSAVLDAAARVAVESLARKAAVVDLATMIIVGHTDKTEGSKVQAQRLSEQRAEAVKSAFVALGLDATKLYIDGKGSSQPISDPATSDGRAKNRRVEVEGIINRPAASVKQ
jgi:OmpA-OmpF porin, OOP family